jgi:putative component of membrane protein insertase Oxa1/YidC/SpoIIIJ protein YidD
MLRSVPAKQANSSAVFGKTSVATDELTLPVRAKRLVTLPNGEAAIDTNGLRYDDYITKIMPNLPLTKAQRWATWMIRRLYQGTTRNTVYKWFGNPCQYKKQGNLSCSEYTLLLIQQCGLGHGVREGWRRISSEGPNPITHPKLWLATIPIIGKRFLDAIPATEVAPADKPIPLSWFKDKTVALKLAQL